MEQVNESRDQSKKAKKRPKDQLAVGNENKKTRLFSPKLFRKQLNQESSHAAVKQFLEAVNDSKTHDYIIEYLDSGGSCLELLQTLELDSSIPPAIVFELLSHILLRINASCPQYESAAYEACRYMLNNYAVVFSKMINLSSTTPERKACLKLLTAMVALSSHLAKDILIHINFHSTNIELLTKHTGEKNSVRDHFIRFLTAYLIDVHYPALSVLLEKKGFITSIVKGLQFDSSDTLCLVISAMKNHILENSYVSKTAKMRTFNTVVVRDIVNLYNWKGPGGMAAQKNNKIINVDQLEKSRVNECVHEFLLVLCTSHKFGVIFRDPFLGLGKKNQNALMYTVLESLDRPWDHSYASELVLKICGACPDLAKTIWANLKPFLVPRMSDKWLSAMKFAKQLIRELQQNCTEFCMKELNVTQLFQIVQCLVSPLPVIKTVLPETNIFESPAIKFNVISLLLEMLKSLNSYLKSLKTSLGAEDHSKLKSYVNNFISKNFLDGVKILNDYQNGEETPEYSQIQFLEVAFDIFEQYKHLSPILLDSLSSDNFEFSAILEKVDNISRAKEIDTSNLKVKMINIFIDFDNSKFLPHTALFSFVVPLLFKKYYSDASIDILTVLNKLLNNSGVFEECSYEINIWINAILNLKKFDENVVLDIIEILKITSENSQAFFDELYSFNSDSGTLKTYSNVLQSILNTDSKTEDKVVVLNHRYLSPVVLGVLKFSSEKEVSKGFKIYANFAFINLLHMQTRTDALVQIIEKCDFLSSSFKEYAVAWRDGQEIISLSKFRGKLDIFEKFSHEFLCGSLDDLSNSEAFDVIPDLLLSLLDASIFYVVNLLNKNLLTPHIVENSRKFVKYLIGRKSINDVFIERLLGHPVLLQNITFLSFAEDESANIGTHFIMNIIRELLDAGYKVESYLMVYRRKLLNAIIKILKKPQKYEQLASNVKELLQLFNLSYDDCFSTLNTISISFEKYQKCNIVLDILVYALEQLTTLCQINPKFEPLNENIVHNLSRYFVILATYQEIDLSNISTVFLSYLETFPHNLKNVDESLFQALLEIQDFSKENIKLAVLLMKKNVNHMNYFERNIDTICEKKGILLPLLAIFLENNTELEVLKQIYDKFESFLNKAIQKPQKAGQHFHQNYKGLVVLIEKCMPEENCQKFWEKIQKFEVTEVFHANLLSAIFLKSSTDEIDAKKINNIIMTFVHLQISVFKRGLKTDEDISKSKSVALIFDDVMNKLKNLAVSKDLKTTSKNETLKLYCKYCLKHGISSHSVFLKSLRSLLDILYSSMESDDGRAILEMLLSHSEFLGTVLGKNSEVKLEVLSLFLELCRSWPEFMERSHVPVLLASYGAMVNSCDKILLRLFKM
ncbi:unnamed protein product [Phaedon cochleariae]|uniref:URB1 N-terminal domain-containing protein n=1 Tax=Phaedon cochleariae TaxID=80249 RepID=A0A9N9X3J2_PHACE|nr:unnamed protein product [Phaedon cochleariae]